MSLLRKTIAVLAAGAAVAGIGQSAALASSQSPNDTFDICGPTPYDYHEGPGLPCVNRSYGGIVWNNRTAQIQGAVTDDVDLWSTTIVFFDSFAGDTKVEGIQRRSERGSVSFNFPIGDLNLVGGIDRVRIQICHYRPPTDPAGKCTRQYNFSRN